MSGDFDNLPPVYEPLRLTVADSAFFRAIRSAERGAAEGTLVQVDAPHSPRTQDGGAWIFQPGDLDMALVLRPDYSAASALELGLVAAVSAGGAIAELVEPMVRLGYGWPDRVQLSGSDVAVLRLALGEGDPPAWLVLGLTVNIVDVELGAERATLNGNGSADCSADTMLACFSRFFLDGINVWAEVGLKSVHRGWTRRGIDYSGSIALSIGGEVLYGEPIGLDAHGALRLATAAGARRITLADFFQDHVKAINGLVDT